MTAYYEGAAWPCTIVGAEDAHMAVVWHQWPDVDGAAGGWLEVARYLADDAATAKTVADHMYQVVARNLNLTGPTAYTWRGVRPAGTGPGRPPSAEHPVSVDLTTPDQLSGLHYMAWTAVERRRLAALEGQ